MQSSVPRIVPSHGEVIEVQYCHRWYRLSALWINGTAEPDQLVQRRAARVRPPSERARLHLGLCNYVELIDTIFTDVEGVD
jgi:hypothetical protein